MAPKQAQRSDVAGRARIQSIERAKAILDVLAARQSGFVPLRDIAEATGLLKTTAFNLVTALVDTGLVECIPRTAWAICNCELIVGPLLHGVAPARRRGREMVALTLLGSEATWCDCLGRVDQRLPPWEQLPDPRGVVFCAGDDAGPVGGHGML